MTNKEAVNWIINLSADIGKSEHSELWHYEQALYEIREMLESARQWIPVTERLPELKERVLVYAEDDKSWYIAISQVLSLSSLKGCFLGFNGTQKVKAWMPLPEPYEEKRDE